MAITVTVDADLARLPGQILVELQRQAVPKLRALADTLLPEVRETVAEALHATPEYSSLVAGQLREEFGVVDGKEAVASIVRAIQAAARVEVIPPAGEYLGGVWAGAIREDFGDALGAEGAYYLSTNAKGQSSPVEWLKWLLFAGDTVVLTEYGLFSGADPSYSRTGRLIMAKRKAGGKLAPFRVPPAYAGTARSNWLTRAAELAAPRLLQFLEREARKLL
jgi:hypothetical protein